MYISMMEAYTIEDLKNRGITYNDVLNQLSTNTYTLYDENTIVEGLKPLFERNQDYLENAYNGKYKISFVTLNGLRNLLKMRFNIPLTSYRTEHNGIFDVKMDEETEKEIRNFISVNWTIKRDGEFISCYVEGK